MKKFLQVAGWIVVVFVCFYLFGLGERTPRKTLEERMERIEETLDSAEEKNWAAIMERYDALDEEIKKVSDELEALKREIEDKTEEQKQKTGDVWDRIKEIERRLEECEGVEDGYDPGEKNELEAPGNMPQFSSWEEYSEYLLG